MAYYSRSSWTSASKGGTRLAGSGRTMRYIYIHYPGQAAAIGRASLASTRNRLEGYRRQHKNVQGWADIAYNLAVDQSGNVWELRGLDRQTGANGGSTSNRHGQAILVLVGNNEAPTAECVAGIKDAVRRVRAAHRQAQTIRGHQQSPDASTACPGPALMRLVRSGGLEPGLPGISGGGATVPRPSVPTSRPPVPASPTFADVDKTQAWLRDLGYDPGPIDGKYGTRTEAATRQAQQDLGITPADGKPGPATRTILEDAVSTINEIKAIVTQNQREIRATPGRVLDAEVDLEGAWKGQKSTLRRMRAWYAEDLRQIKEGIATSRAAVLKAVQETGKAQGLTDAQVQAVASAAAEAAARVSAEDVAERLEVTVAGNAGTEG